MAGSCQHVAIKHLWSMQLVKYLFYSINATSQNTKTSFHSSPFQNKFLSSIGHCTDYLWTWYGNVYWSTLLLYTI